ncbi:MAG TPA: twin-arginine translocase subunit TatC [Jatrophihabitans sp.]|nr:twin-arginine translocase subunit TatC [Jatrophihabitans sp.]
MSWLSRQRRPANPEGRMSVLDHLRELRRRLIIVMLLVAAGAVIGYLAYNQILAVLKHPYCHVDYHHRFGARSQGECDLVFRQPLDGFTTRLKVSVIAGTIITSPFWLYQLWAFVTPGLRRNERRWSIGFISSSLLLFACGGGLAYLTLAKGLDILISSSGTGVQSQLDVASYISFVTLVILVFGASFELPLLIVMLNAVRVLPFSILKRGQRLGIFLIFLFAAVATPSTDPFTMIAMAVPMVLLFELAVLWCFLYDRRRARRQLAEAEQQLPDDIASTVNPIPERIEQPEWTDLP